MRGVAEIDRDAGHDRREADRIDSRAAGDGVLADRGGEDRVVAPAAVDGVDPRAAVDRIVAEIAGERVVADAARKHVVAAAARQHVRARGTGDNVVTRPADDVLDVAETVSRVGEVDAQRCGGAGEADGVDPGLAVDQVFTDDQRDDCVVAVAGIDCIDSRLAREGVVAGPAIQRIVASAPKELVVAAISI